MRDVYLAGHSSLQTVMTLDLLSLAQTMPFWRETHRYLTAHCGLTLIGDQKQTIIQAYTRPKN